MKNAILRRASLAFITLFTGMQHCLAVSLPARGLAGFWETNKDGHSFIERQSDLTFGTPSGTSDITITLDTSSLEQEITGFGGAMTHSAANLINNHSNRANIIQELFDRENENGVGANFVRIPIGTSDYALPDATAFSPAGPYSAQDDPSIPVGISPITYNASAPDLMTNIQYALDRDIIEVLQDALIHNPDLQITAVPWSAPLRWKNNPSWTGDGFNDTFKTDYAVYFADFIEYYAGHGIEIESVSIQNEPLNIINTPSMSLTIAQSVDLMIELDKVFTARGLDTKLLVFNHNMEDDYYPRALYNSLRGTTEGLVALNRVIGTGWHVYDQDNDGDYEVTAMGDFQDELRDVIGIPNKQCWITERTGSNAINFAADMQWFWVNITYPAMKNEASGFLWWNFMLDYDGKPNLVAGDITRSRGMFQLNADNSISHTGEAAILGHFSKFVDPGALRLTTAYESLGVYQLAFSNPDGSIAVILYNNDLLTTRSVEIVANSMAFQASIKPQSLVTFQFYQPGSASTTSSGQNLLSNPEFTSGASGWGTFGNTSFDDFFGGNDHASFFGADNGNAGGVFQQGIAALAGNDYTFDLTDFLLEDNFAGSLFVSLEFYAGDDTTLLGEQSLSLTLAIPDPAPAAGTLKVTATAPVGSVYVRPVIRFENADGSAASSENFFVFAASLTDDTAGGGQNLLTNPGFDITVSGWGNFGNTDFNDFFGGNEHASLFADVAGNFGGIFQQGIAASLGNVYTFNLTDFLFESNFAGDLFITLEFYEGDDSTLIDSVDLELNLAILDPAPAPGTLTVTATPPVGTAFIRPVIRFENADGSAGANESFFVFNASLTAVPLRVDSEQNLLNNPGFDNAGSGWGNFGNTGFNDFFGGNEHASFFADAAANAGGVFQTGIAAMVGNQYTLNLTDFFLEANFGGDLFIALEFYGADDATLVDSTSLELNLAVLDTAPAAGTLTVSATAPAGAVYVRPVIRFENAIGSETASENFFVFEAALTTTPIQFDTMLTYPPLLEFATVNGRSYSVLASSSLDGPFVKIGTIIGDGNLMSFSDNRDISILGPTHFYIIY